MELLSAIILGLVQGLTEFIPVSSSGHLILIGQALNFQYSGLAFDTALDVGTLMALAAFFARDFYSLGRDVVFGGERRRLGLLIIAATVPAVLAGILLQDTVETVFRSSRLVAVNLIVVGIIMWIVDKRVSQKKDLKSVGLATALTVGVAQAVALVPGVSRSGATITAGRALGLDRVSATKFSFWLSAPIIFGATAKVMISGPALNQMAQSPDLFLAGILAAFFSGYLAIKFLINFLSRHGLAVFAVYRIVLGVVILILGVFND